MASDQSQLSNEDAQNLIQQLVGWAKQGGGNATSAYIGSNGTDVNQVASPGIAANAAQSISGGQQGNGGNFVGGNSGPQDSNTPPPLNPYQKGVAKMLAKAGEAHAQQAIQAGMDPNAIASHAAMQTAQSAQPTQQNNVKVPTGQAPTPSAKQVQVPTGQGRVTQNPSMYMKDPYKTPAGVNSPPQNNAQPPLQATPEPDQTQANYKQANLLLSQQALKEAQPRTWMQSFRDNFAKMSNGVTQADRLANLAAGQKIAGGEQLQPKDLATLTSDQWKAGLDATKTSLTAEAQNLSNLVDLHGKLENTKGRINQIFGNPSDDQKKVIGKINESYGNVGTLINSIGTFANNPPKFNGAGQINPQTQSIVNNIEQGKKVGKYTLVSKK